MAGTSNSGRKELPKEIKQLKGTLRNFREKGKNPPKPGKATSLEPPEYLNAIAKEEYRRKAELLDRLGVLKDGDCVALAAYADAYARWVHCVGVMNTEGGIIAGKDGQPIRNPITYNLNNALDQMYKFLTEFGLTPVSRSKVRVDDEPKKNEWEMFTGSADVVQKTAIQ